MPLGAYDSELGQWSGLPNGRVLQIDVSGLNVVQGRAGVFVIPNTGPLDLAGRIVSWGQVP
jgi:hypothetical protein